MDFAPDAGITWQQRAAYDRLEKALEVVDQKSRAQTQTSIALIGLSSAGVSLLAADGVEFGDRWQIGVGLLVVTGLAALVVQVLALFVGRIAFVSIPGTTDTDRLWEAVISRDDQKAFNKLLIDVAECVEQGVRVVETRAVLLDIATIAIAAQAALTIAVLVVANWG